MSSTLKSRLFQLYKGHTAPSQRFRYGLLLFDLFSVAFFVATLPLPNTPYKSIS